MRILASELDIRSKKIIHVASPTDTHHAVNKGYADGLITGLFMKADKTLAGATPVNADVSTWANGDRGIGIGTGGRIFMMYKYSGAVKYVELS
jgi:hypothetical protein